MEKPILILISLFFVFPAFGNMVEFEFPIFNKKVQEQAKGDLADSDEHCTVDQQGGQNSSITCSTDKNPKPQRDLGDESSQFARDEINKLRREKR